MKCLVFKIFFLLDALESFKYKYSSLKETVNMVQEAFPFIIPIY